jgi:hypothetical protein
MEHVFAFGDPPSKVKIVIDFALPIYREICKTIRDPRLEGFILGKLVRYKTAFHGYVIDLNRSE